MALATVHGRWSNSWGTEWGDWKNLEELTEAAVPPWPSCCQHPAQPSSHRGVLSHSAGCWRGLWGSTYFLICISRRLPRTPLAGLGLAELFSAHPEPGHSHQRAYGPPPPPPPIPTVQGQRLLRSPPPSPSSPWPCGSLSPATLPCVLHSLVHRDTP
ncbi:hypothetical protein P7K49_009702 [Saguinus oedipus]|uniref:Uncharacterized protein n=1 Tax=Saguinus oedipus TaxID=9490 RepID=A0ABQ9VLD3_SAGOE|nr:hypothetical protein P7K49_009702 [Saguinus oedipus]